MEDNMNKKMEITITKNEATGECKFEPAVGEAYVITETSIGRSYKVGDIVIPADNEVIWLSARDGVQVDNIEVLEAQEASYGETFKVTLIKKLHITYEV